MAPQLAKVARRSHPQLLEQRSFHNPSSHVPRPGVRDAGRASQRALAAAGVVTLVPTVVLVEAPLLRAVLGVVTLLLLGVALRHARTPRAEEAELELVPAPRRPIADDPASAGRVRELEHRLKNLLATVSGVLDQVRSRGDDAERSLDEFERRLRELRRLHEALVVGPGGGTGVDLRDLLTLALEPFDGPAENGRVALRGPRVLIPRHAVLPLGTALCELTTNALKYGALSDRRGHVRVEWDVLRTESAGEEPAPPGALLRLDWIEADGPRVKAPGRRGYGTTMLERSLAYELDGHVELDFDEAGLRCRMDLSFTALECDSEAAPLPALERGARAVHAPLGPLTAMTGAFEVPARKANGAL